MKKIIVISLVFIVLMLSACETDTARLYNSDYNYITDMQYCYNNISNERMNCTVSQTGYYYLGSHNMIIYIDKATLKSTPLCSKANCLHNDKDTCDAYGYNKIQYNNGYLYTEASEYSSKKLSDIQYIYKVTEDGTSKEKLTNGFDEMLYDWFIHRDYIYYVTLSGLYRLPLSAPKNESQQLISFKNLKCDNINIEKFTAYKSYVYLGISSLFEDENSNDHNVFNNLYAYDVTADKYSRIFEDDFIPQIATFFEDKMVTYKAVKNSDDTYNTVYYTSDLNGSNTEKLAEFKSGYYLYSDGKYIYVDDGAYKNFSDISNDFHQTVEVYSLDMNKLYSFTLPFSEWIDMCPQDTKSFLLADNSELFCISKNDFSKFDNETAYAQKLCSLNWLKKQQY